jgi:hypothetical protein
MKSYSIRVALAVLGALPMLDAQTLVDLRTQSKSIDFSTALSTRPFQTGAVLPAGSGLLRYGGARGEESIRLYGC